MVKNDNKKTVYKGKGVMASYKPTAAGVGAPAMFCTDTQLNELYDSLPKEDMPVQIDSRFLKEIEKPLEQFSSNYTYMNEKGILPAGLQSDPVLPAPALSASLYASLHEPCTNDMITKKDIEEMDTADLERFAKLKEGMRQDMYRASDFLKVGSLEDLNKAIDEPNASKMTFYDTYRGVCYQVSDGKIQVIDVDREIEDNKLGEAFKYMAKSGW